MTFAEVWPPELVVQQPVGQLPWDTTQPIGVAEYQLVEALPKDLEASLPSIGMIEREMGGEE